MWSAPPAEPPAQTTLEVSAFTAAARSLIVLCGEFAGTTITSWSAVRRAIGVTASSVTGDLLVSTAPTMVMPITISWLPSPLAWLTNCARPTVPPAPGTLTTWTLLAAPVAVMHLLQRARRAVPAAAGTGRRRDLQLERSLGGDRQGGRGGETGAAARAPRREMRFMCMFVLRKMQWAGRGLPGLQVIVNQYAKCRHGKHVMPQPGWRLPGRQLRFVDLHAYAGEQLAQPALGAAAAAGERPALRARRGAARPPWRRCSSGCERGSSEVEIPFQPGRVLMHDTTSTPALVDIAAMRDELAEAGRRSGRAAARGCRWMSRSTIRWRSRPMRGPTRSAVNMQHELRRNAERYRFLRWASKALPGVRIHPPGTGIMHTINLEQLATVVTTEHRDGASGRCPT